MTKKTQKKVEKTIANVISEAEGIKLNAKIILSFVKNNDIKGLEKEIETRKKIIEEQGKIDELIQNSSLNKQALNIMGLTARNDWNFYTQAGTKWLLPVAKIMLSQEWKEFLNSDFRLKDYEKLIPVFKK